MNGQPIQETYNHPTKCRAILAYRLQPAASDPALMYAWDEHVVTVTIAGSLRYEFSTPNMEAARDSWRWARRSLITEGYIRETVNPRQSKLPLATQPTGRGPYRSGT